MDWKLTRSAIGRPEIVVLDDDEDLTWGFSVMRELARDHPDLEEVADGVWRAVKPIDVREL